MPILLVATGLLLWFLQNQELSRVEGGILFGGLVAFLVLSGITSIKQMKEKRGEEPEILEDLDPEAGDAPIVRERIDDAGLNCVLSNSFGFGGTNASLVFGPAP